MENVRRVGLIGSSLEASVTLKGREETIEFLNSFGLDELKDLLILSGLNLTTKDVDRVEVEVRHAPGSKCERCWKWSVSAGENEHPTLCTRCVEELKRI